MTTIVNAIYLQDASQVLVIVWVLVLVIPLSALLKATGRHFFVGNDISIISMHFLRRQLLTNYCRQVNSTFITCRQSCICVHVDGAM